MPKSLTDIDLGSAAKVKNAVDPTSAQDYATKNYVDQVGVGGGRSKQADGTRHLVLPGVAVQGNVTTENGAVAANTDYIEPFLLRQPSTLAAMYVEVTTAQATGGSKMRLAIYKADADWQPTSLVIDAGLVAIDAIAVVSAAAVATLQPGRYVKVRNQSNAGGVFRAVPGAVTPSFVATLGANAAVTRMAVGRTHAAFPGTGTTWTTTTGAGSQLPHVIFLDFSSAG